jgi:putative oxidoreductase
VVDTTAMSGDSLAARCGYLEPVQRFFSPFASGRAGVGLLLLRVAAALTAMSCGVVRLTESPNGALDKVSAALSIASGLAVLVGLLTTGSAIILAVTIAWFWFPVHSEARPQDLSAALLTIADGVTISLLGPGAFSVDARLFGPREIVISRQTRAPQG